MRPSIIGILLALLLALLAACTTNDSAINRSDSGDSGTLQLWLTDAPANVEEVNITFSQISAHIDSAWITVTDTPRTINLLEWNNGRSILVGNAELPAGDYTQIRLKIDSATILVDSSYFPLDVPSGARSGLKLLAHFTIAEGGVQELVMDFDADRSIVRMGPPRNPRGYKLKPTIRVTARTTSGAISGRVLNPENIATAYAIQQGDTITGSRVDNFTGEFQLAFLAEGFYSVHISDTLNQQYQRDSVLVARQRVNNLGDVLLQ